MENKPEVSNDVSSDMKTPKIKEQNLINEKEIIEFNNNYVIQKIEKNKKNKTRKIIEELKLIYPLADDLLIELYNKSISIHQSNIQGNGDFLENDIVVTELISKKIPFKDRKSTRLNSSHGYISYAVFCLKK